MNGKMPNLDIEYVKSVEFMTKFVLSIVTDVKRLKRIHQKNHSKK